MTITNGLRVKRELVDCDTSTCTLVFEAMTSIGRHLEIAVPRSEIARPHDILQQLARRGWVDAYDRKKAHHQIEHALAQRNWPVVKVTSRTGWNDPEHFVLPHRTIGPTVRTVFFANGGGRPTAPACGDLRGWRQGLRDPCRASSYLTFASALAMAGALLYPLDQEEGAIFQLTGKSSTGKTLSLRVAQSAMGPADISGVLTHDATDRAIEEHLAAANHGLLCIDELARLQGTPGKKRERIRHLPHMLASGVGRVRSKSVELEHLDRKTYRLLGLSTGELPLESYGEREEGERVRYPDIPVPPGGEHGIFDRLAEDQDAKALAAQAEEAIRTNYGVVYEAFIERLVSDRAAATIEAKTHIEQFLAKAAPDATSWEHRFALKFALVYAAAALASEWKILPFGVIHARNSIIRLHRKARIEARTAEDAKLALIEWLSRNATTHRFPVLKKGEPFPDTPRVWGFRRRKGDTMTLAVVPAELKKHIRPERHERSIQHLLADEGVLMRQREGRFETQLTVEGLSSKRPMFFCFDVSKLPHGNGDS